MYKSNIYKKRVASTLIVSASLLTLLLSLILTLLLSLILTLLLSLILTLLLSLILTLLLSLILTLLLSLILTLLLSLISLYQEPDRYFQHVITFVIGAEWKLDYVYNEP